MNIKITPGTSNAPTLPQAQKIPVIPKPTAPLPVVPVKSPSYVAKEAPKIFPTKTRDQATNEMQSLLLELIESIDTPPLDPKSFPPFNAEDWKEKDPEPVPDKKAKPAIPKSKSSEPDVANPFGYVPYIPEIQYVPKPKAKDEGNRNSIILINYFSNWVHGRFR